MKEMLKQQIAWREELAASGVHVGIPTFQPPKGITIVSSSAQGSTGRPVTRPALQQLPTTARQ